MNASSSPINIDPEIMGGAPVFRGTRVPVRALWDYLESGDPLDLFLDHFPTVSRESAIAVMEYAREAADSHARAA
jgi:uncharacterized protein (DUF433 family)